METLPIPRFFQVCVGMIGISPREFWSLSLSEVYLAIEGFKEFNTADTTDRDPMNQDRLQELMELYPD